MGMSASILAFGPFRQNIASYLAYPANYYARCNTREGALVLHQWESIVEGTANGTMLANLLGISDPFDFNEHVIRRGDIDILGLRAFLERTDDPQYNLEKLNAFIKLADAGFTLIFLPEF